MMMGKSRKGQRGFLRFRFVNKIERLKKSFSGGKDEN